MKNRKRQGRRDCVPYCFLIRYYWTVTLFNPDNSAETMERILALTDWLCSEECICYTQMGLKGIEWDLDDAGLPYMLDAAKDSEGNVKSMYDRHNSYRIWRQLGYLSDDFNFVSPAYEHYLQEMCSKMYALKSEADVIIPVNWDYTFYTSEAKSIYSVNIDEAMTKFIIGTDDIDTGWAEFVKENAGMVQPILDDFNATH